MCIKWGYLPHRYLIIHSRHDCCCSGEYSTRIQTTRSHIPARQNADVGIRVKYSIWCGSQGEGNDLKCNKQKYILWFYFCTELLQPSIIMNLYCMIRENYGRPCLYHSCYTFYYHYFLTIHRFLYGNKRPVDIWSMRHVTASIKLSQSRSLLNLICAFRNEFACPLCSSSKFLRIRL